MKVGDKVRRSKSYIARVENLGNVLLGPKDEIGELVSLNSNLASVRFKDGIVDIMVANLEVVGSTYEVVLSDRWFKVSDAPVIKGKTVTFGDHTFVISNVLYWRKL